MILDKEGLVDPVPGWPLPWPEERGAPGFKCLADALGRCARGLDDRI